MTQFNAETERELAIEKNSKIINRTDVQQLVKMLSYKRPSGHQFKEEYKEFIDTYLIPYFGEPDRHGNFILINPDYDEEGNQIHPRIAYMAHHDTVHRVAGRQTSNIKYNPEAQGDVFVYVHNDTVPRIKRTQTVKTGKKRADGKDYYETREYEAIDTQDPFYSNCLGADCTTGVWLIIQMIQAGCPGVYVVHEDEEIGCIGSSGIVNDYIKMSNEDKANHWISHVDIAMSFDRYGETSIITYQSSSRTASDKFAESLSNITKEFFDDRGYKPLKADDGGSYTDSNEYCDHISECTNISVGYYNQHSEKESQNIEYVLMLRDCLVKYANDFNNPAILIADRDPNEVDTLYGGGWGRYGNYYGSNYYRKDDSSYTFGYRITDPFDYNENPDPYANGYSNDEPLRLEYHSEADSYKMTVSEVEDVEYEFEEYVQDCLETDDVFDARIEGEIETMSEWLRLFPYLAASLLQNNNIGSTELIAKIKSEAVRRNRLLSYEKLFRKDKDKLLDDNHEEDEIPF